MQGVCPRRNRRQRDLRRFEVLEQLTAAAGYDAHLRKPADPSGLIALVIQLMART